MHVFRMLLSRDYETGIERIWVTQFASVQSYFTLNQEGTGLTLHLEPGFAAYPEDFKRAAEHVRHCVLDHVAERLGVLPHQVLDQPLAALREVCDPAVPDRYRYIRRQRSRSR